MLQDISPKKYYCEYHAYTPKSNDYVLLFEGNEVLLKSTEAGDLAIPRFDEFSSDLLARVNSEHGYQYLFSLDDERFFLSCSQNSFSSAGTAPIDPSVEFVVTEVFLLRQMAHNWMSFAGLTAHQLYLWYRNHRFCGCCGDKTIHGADERVLSCPTCKTLMYPRISPVVIAAVTDGNRILLTRPIAARYEHYALVAGFVEIGETFEDAVRREVREETGVSVTNIRYYKSQPWGLSSSLLAGYICDLEGSSAITMQESELAEAIWLERESIPVTSKTFALTAEMIEAFRTNTLE